MSFESGLIEYDESEPEYDESEPEYDESEPESRKRYRRRTRSYAAGSTPITRGGIRLPTGGTAQVQLPPVVKQADFKNAMEAVRADHNRDQQSMAALEKRLDSNLKNMRNSMQMSSMLPLMMSFMTPRPDFSHITISPQQPDYRANPANPTLIRLDSTTPRTQDSMLPMMMMMMMMMGGMGGGGGGLFGSGDKGGGGNMMMMMMMMMIMIPMMNQPQQTQPTP